MKSRSSFGLLSIAMVAFACEPGGETKARSELLVYAATSTRDALQALENDYERDHAVDLVFNFGASGDLANQILAASKAGVFLSADEREMDRIEGQQQVAAGSRVPLLSNQLVVIGPSDGPTGFAEPFDANQLTLPRIERLSLADVEAVPAGRYAKAWLESRNVWTAVSARVLPAVDVRAALAAVESGAAQAGIVYRTDAARSTKVRVVHTVPLPEGPRITYPVAAIANAKTERDAREFVAYLSSPSAGAVFERFGFVFLPAQAASSR
jgi:molybdate transport system substrate-binding protein